MLVGVMKRLSEQRDRFEQLEEERIKQEDEIAKHESAKDESVQFDANMSQNPDPSTLFQPHSRPVASSAGSSYGFDPENEEHESD